MTTNLITRLATVATLLGLAACSTTSVEEMTEKVSGTVTVTAKAPVVVTRAPSGMVLRYKAFLFTETENTLGDIVAVQEKLASNGSGEFTFSGVENGTYAFIFVADYIDSGATVSNKSLWGKNGTQITFSGYSDDNGQYSTSFTNQKDPFTLTMKIDSKDIYNNDGYEVFVGKNSFTKGNDKYNGSITLKRPVCKVTVAEKTEAITGLKCDVTALNMSYSYDLYNGTVIPSDFTNDTDPEENSFLKTGIELANVDNKELFYFYAFANESPEATEITNSNGLKFTIKGKPVDITQTIPAEKLIFLQNYKYTLKGNFIRTDFGDVNISVGINENWTTDSTTDLTE